ncbi:hypothetical protein ACIOYV_00705 [Pseudomonas sp. NPDC087342]|uniref:hypothetical protein n=1 Tax=Pseudomonas sp. NPDC087342 TaxID=3364437 RepID=UPI003817D02A
MTNQSSTGSNPRLSKKPSESPGTVYGDLDKSVKVLMPVLLLGLLAALVLGLSANAMAAVILWVVACLVAGATVGFLFGIPKSAAPSAALPDKAGPGSASPRNEAGGRPNTNLEEVSDWLTKIIVGLGLVHLKDINAYILKISHTAAASLNATPTPRDVSVAMALVIGFVVLGFLFGYLYTRLFLQGAFQRSDYDMTKRSREALELELENTPPATMSVKGEDSMPTEEDRLSAERVRQIVPADQPEEALAPLRSLAAEFEQLRREMPYGNERTRKMADIAKKMKSLGLVATKFLPQLTQSHSPGERLAAIMALQMQFDPAYINWLAERLVVEPAFPGYQAAIAFLARLPTVGRVEAEEIKSAVKKAVQQRLDNGVEPETSLDQLCERILAHAQ